MLCRILLAAGLTLVLLATAVGLLAVAVRLTWQPVPPPPAAVTLDERAELTTSRPHGSSALQLLSQAAGQRGSVRPL